MKVEQLIFTRVDGSGLIAWRMILGLVLVYESVTLAKDGFHKLHFYSTQRFQLPVTGFEPVLHLFHLVQAATGGWAIYFESLLMMITAFATLIGFQSRWAVLVFFLIFGQFFVIDTTTYLNHHYLILILCAIFIFFPSTDLKTVRSSKTKFTVPVWPYILLRGVILIVYFYAGVVKLNSDWLHGEPVAHWVRQRGLFRTFGPHLEQTLIPHFVAYAGIILDLVVAPLQTVRRCRLLAALLLFAFHSGNKIIFDLGSFPALMIGTILIFFPPDTPRYLATLLFVREKMQNLNSKYESRKNRINDNLLQNTINDKLTKNTINDKLTKNTINDNLIQNRINDRLTKNIINDKLMEKDELKIPQIQKYLILILFCTVWGHQICTPLRGFLFGTGPINWTEEGYQFSWRMMLNSKEGFALFHISDPNEWIRSAASDTSGSDQLLPTPSPIITLNMSQVVGEEARRLGRLDCRPWVILNLAHHLAENWTPSLQNEIRETGQGKIGDREQAIFGGHRLKVTADVFCSLNFGKFRRLINATVDLAQVPLNVWAFNDFVLPFESAEIISLDAYLEWAQLDREKFVKKKALLPSELVFLNS